MKRDLDRLEHIIEAIDRIQKYSSHGEIVWSAVENELPRLREWITAILKGSNEGA